MNALITALASIYNYEANLSFAYDSRFGAKLIYSLFFRWSVIYVAVNHIEWNAFLVVISQSQKVTRSYQFNFEFQ